jgi:hypothetical protein
VLYLHNHPPKSRRTYANRLVAGNALVEGTNSGMSQNAEINLGQIPIVLDIQGACGLLDRFWAWLCQDSGLMAWQRNISIFSLIDYNEIIAINLGASHEQHHHS